ncbi:uncharacterized, partial [Tachysurus ichikawai]
MEHHVCLYVCAMHRLLAYGCYGCHCGTYATGIKSKNKAFLLDDPISSHGLFGDTEVSSIQRANPLAIHEPGLSTRQPKPKPSSHRQEHKASVVAHAPLAEMWSWLAPSGTVSPENRGLKVIHLHQASYKGLSPWASGL